MTMLRSCLLSLGTKAIETILNLALIAILARLLEPTDFGIFAIVLAVQALLQPLVDMGLTPAYIKAKKPTQELKNSFFTLNVALGVFNVAVLFILAPIVSYVYDSQVLFHLIAAFSFSVIFNSISRQGYAQLTRDKRFDQLMMVSFISNLVTFALSVYFAYENFGVWVLVIKAISLNIVSALMIGYFVKAKYKITPWRTIRQFTNELKFGFEVFINRVFNGIFNAGEKFIFGKIFGTELLGHYSNAQQIARMGDTHVRMPITSAIYSYLERYTETNKKQFYDKFSSLIFTITSLFTGLLVLEGDKFIFYLLGEKWTFASEYIRPLALFGMGLVIKGIYTIISMSENNMRSQNRRVLGSILILPFLSFSSLFFSIDAHTYVIVFSIAFILYWIVSLIKELIYLNSVKHFVKSILHVYGTILVLEMVKIRTNENIFELILIPLIYIISISGYLYLNNKVKV